MTKSKETSKSKGGKSQQRRFPTDHNYVETLAELEAYTDTIIDELNNDKRLMLLAVADPVGVLRELGYELSEDTARQLKCQLPRMSRQDRDRYLTCLRLLKTIPESLDIKLRKRPSVNQLLEEGSLQTISEVAQEAVPKNNPGQKAGKGTSGFDALMQFGESFCEKMLQLHYVRGRLPRSVYEITGKLYFFLHTGDYEDYRMSLGDADRKIHFSKPAMAFVGNEPNRVCVTFPFVAIGFDAKPVIGVGSVFGVLGLAKDTYGYPSFIEMTFDGLKATDTSIQVTSQTVSQSVLTKLKGTVHTAWRDFRKLAVGWKISLKLPISFPIVDGEMLALNGVSVKPGEVVFAIKKPTGGGSLLLSVGFNRAKRKGSGNIDTCPDHIKPGAQYAFFQDTAWLEEGMNASFAKALPIRFDPKSGKQDQNGDFRLDSIVWSYRNGGLTGKLEGLYENYFLWINMPLKSPANIDIKFHSSDPELEMTLAGGPWEVDDVTNVLIILLSMLGGAFAGGLIGAMTGTLTYILFGVPLGIGAATSGVAGLLTGLHLVGLFPASFDSKGLPPGQPQTINLTYQQALPDLLETVQVVPNDVRVSEAGILLSAKLVGPVAVEEKPYLVVKGRFSVEFEKSWLEKPWPSSTPPKYSNNESETGLNTQVPKLGDLVEASSKSLSLYAIGQVSLSYAIMKTWGLQGRLEYLWTFNGVPVGNGPGVKVDVPLTRDMFNPAGIEFNKVTVLGIVKLAVVDTFGRKATWEGVLSIGSEKDYRPMREPGLNIPEWVDLDPFGRRTELEGKEFFGPPELPEPPGPLVGWALGGGDVVVPQGMLVSQTTVSLPQLGHKLFIICTTPEVMKLR